MEFKTISMSVGPAQKNPYLDRSLMDLFKRSFVKK